MCVSLWMYTDSSSTAGCVPFLWMELWSWFHNNFWCFWWKNVDRVSRSVGEKVCNASAKVISSKWDTLSSNIRVIIQQQGAECKQINRMSLYCAKQRRVHHRVCLYQELWQVLWSLIVCCIDWKVLSKSTNSVRPLQSVVVCFRPLYRRGLNT